MSEKKTIKVSKLGETIFFQVMDSNKEILFECTDIIRNWGISRCADWIRRYNEEHDETKESSEPITDTNPDGESTSEDTGV